LGGGKGGKKKEEKEEVVAHGFLVFLEGENRELGDILALMDR